MMTSTNQANEGGRRPAKLQIVVFDRAEMRRALQEKGLLHRIKYLNNALRMNGTTTQMHNILKGTRTPSGFTVALVARLIGEPVDRFYKLRPRRRFYTIEEATEELDSRNPVGRPRGTKT